MVKDFGINYYDNTEYSISQKTKKTIQKVIKRLEKKYDKTFLENLNLNIATDFAHLPSNNNLFEFLNKNEEMFDGTAACLHQAYIDNIFFQQSAIIKKNSNTNVNSQKIKQRLTHEMGHRFDILYGNLDENLEKQYREIVAKHDLSGMDYSEKELELINRYTLQNSYSDREDFVLALQKDLENFDFNNKDRIEEYEYFLRQILLLSEGEKPTLENIINADNSRSEIFADAFSYLNGGTDSSKKDFLTTFSNTVDVVRKYMQKHTNK